MAKKECAICGKPLGALAAKALIADGVVCVNCLARARIAPNAKLQNYNATILQTLINRRETVINSFLPTKKVGTYIAIDEKHKSFKIGGDIFEYANLLSYELFENDSIVTKGGIGRAVAGGLLFGGVGAIVGGVTGRKTNSVCNSMRIRVTLRNAHIDTKDIVFIASETKTKSFVYKTAQDSAHACISALAAIADQKNASDEAIDCNTSQVISAADEIIKFKQLMDNGIITLEEFELKKKQLLGL